MAHFGKDLDDFNSSRYIHIRSAEQTENFTLYVITVSVGPYSWNVKHRYSEFYDLHEKLCASCKLDKSLLPPKKLFGNQTEAFIKKRQRELEIYLQTVLYYLAQHVPSTLAYFLHFDKYEIHGVTQSMAEDLYSRGESLLQTKDKYQVTPLQLYSLTERLKLPEPTCDSGDVKKDLGHILDFITRAKHLKVIGGSSPVGTSNILLNKLVFDLTLFKSLQTLEICGCNFRLIKGLETVKQTLTNLEVHESSSSLKEMLLQEFPHWKAEDGSLLVCNWDNVTSLDLSNNSISELHECIQLMPNVENLNLKHNELETIQNLQWLSQLTWLDLSYNNIRNLDSLHTKLGNVKVLCLAHNQLENLRGFAKLYSLQTLDVTHNSIVSIEEVLHVSQLPCVENFLLVGNMVTNSLDYRTKTLEMFGDRVAEVKLDGQTSSEKELSTVAVLQALRKARTTRAPRRMGQSRNASAANLTDYNPSPVGSLGDPMDRGSSPFILTTGPISASVPTAIPGAAEEGRRTSITPESVASSYGSVTEADSRLKLDGKSSSPLVSRSLEGAPSSSTQAAILTMIPEAHPFDLSCPVVGQLSKPGPMAGQLASSLRPSKEEMAGVEIRSDPSTEDTLLDSVHSDSESSQVSATHLPEKRKLMSTCNATDLPKATDKRFVLWLTQQLSTSCQQETSQASDSTPPSSSSHPHASDRSPLTPVSTKAADAVVVEVVWCLAQSLAKPDSLVPCCAVLTASTIFVEQLAGVESTFPGVPVLEPLHILPLKSIQQMVLGPCHSFLRLEEAFVGPTGTFTLFCLDPNGIQLLAHRVLSLSQTLDTACDLDYVDLNGGSDLLQRIVAHEEELGGLASDRLVVMIPVRLQQDDDYNDGERFHFLLLSENRVYCLDLSCAQWPPPCFQSLPNGVLTFNVIHEFSVADKLVDVKIHALEDGDLDYESPRRKLGLNFTAYPLSLTVEKETENAVRLPNVSSSDGCLSATYRFPSAAFRDQFLDRLSNLRAEQANRMSPNVREEPEGGNEQTSDSLKCDKNNSSSYAQNKVRGFSDRQTKVVMEEGLNTRPIPVLQSNKALEHNGVSVAESFRSLHSSSSSESFCSIIESEEADDGMAECRSSSPKRGQLSTSPMSNFSRASISPPINQSDGAKLAIGESCRDSDQLAIGESCRDSDQLAIGESCRDSDQLAIGESCRDSDQQGKPKETQPQSILQSFCTNSTSKAGSLPSSFDWKSFYFASSHAGADKDNSTTKSVQVTSQERTSQPVSPSRASLKDPAPKSPLLLKLAMDASAHRMETAETLDQNETELDRYLKKCVGSFDLISPLSPKMKPLCLMKGDELRHFFHAAVAHQSTTHLDSSDGLAEELHHVVWAMAVPYSNPRQEITTLLMLSTYAAYLVSDTGVKVSQSSRPSWMTHSRNQSDSAVAWKTADSDQPPGSTVNRRTVQPYLVLRYKDLHQVNVGLFDQCVRLTGHNENEVVTIATRDSQVTETLVEKLKQVLSLSVSSPMLERCHQDLEADFYRDVSQRTKTTVEGLVYTHPSQVNFVYPGDEAVTDVLYLIREKVTAEGGSKLSDKISSLWLYMQCYLLPSDDAPSSGLAVPRTVLLTATHFTLAEEDVVTYPLPDFVRGLPENPCHRMLECRPIDSLKRVHRHHSNPHWLTLTFVEEQPDLVVDVTMQHFGQTGRERQKVAPQVTRRLFVQSLTERDKFVHMLEKVWKQQVAQVGRILDVGKI